MNLQSIWSRIATSLKLTGRQLGVVVGILAASLMVNLAAGRVERLFELLLEPLRKCEWAWPAVQAAGLLLVAIAGVVLGARAYRGATAHRLVAQKREAEAVDVLILPVSHPKRSDKSNFDAAMLAKVKKLAKRDSSVTAMKGDANLDFDKDDFLEVFTCPRLRIDDNDDGNRFSAFTWTTGFKTIDFFLKSSVGRLRAIHLVPSVETAKDDLAKTYYGEMLASLIGQSIKCEPKLAVVGEEDWKNDTLPAQPFHPIVHDGIDYNDFEAVQTKIQNIIDIETNRHGHARSGEFKIAIDVTGGSSAFSAVAAIESTREHVLYSYIPPLAEDKEKTAETLHDPRCYNVVAKSVSGL
jgi:hypothetical protein